MGEAHKNSALVAKSDEALLLLPAPECVERVADHLLLRCRVVVAVGRRIGSNPIAERFYEQRDHQSELLARYRARIAPHFDDRDPIDRFHLNRDANTIPAVEIVKRLHVLLDRTRECSTLRFADHTADDEEKRDRASA